MKKKKKEQRRQHHPDKTLEGNCFSFNREGGGKGLDSTIKQGKNYVNVFVNN